MVEAPSAHEALMLSQALAGPSEEPFVFLDLLHLLLTATALQKGYVIWPI